MKKNSGIDVRHDTEVIESVGQNPPVARISAGVIAQAGALAGAIMASACCWLPLLLIVFGVSGGALSATFEAWRPVLLPITFMLLVSAFYFTYRKPKAARDGNIEEQAGESCCAVPAPDAGDPSCCPSENATGSRVKNVNKVMLWVVTTFVLAFAFFPNYVGPVLGGSGPAMAARDDLDTLVVKVQGMTCESCAVAIGNAVQAVPDVAGAEVSFEKGELLIGIPKGTKAPRSEILAAISRAGYSGRFTNQDDAGKVVDGARSPKSESSFLRFFKPSKKSCCP